MYKKILDELLPEEESTIVMDTNNDKEDRYKAYRRSKDEEEKILDRLLDTTVLAMNAQNDKP